MPARLGRPGQARDQDRGQFRIRWCRPGGTGLVARSQGHAGALPEDATGMSAPMLKIEIRGDLLAKLPKLTSQAAMANELRRTMDEQDQYTVGHVMTHYLSFPATGPTTKEGLRSISNRLR